METETHGQIFAEMARVAELPVKPMYRLREVERASGIPYSTLSLAVRSGEMKSFMPVGQSRGMRVKPEWFDPWSMLGVRNAS